MLILSLSQFVRRIGSRGFTPWQPATLRQAQSEGLETAVSRLSKWTFRRIRVWVAPIKPFSTQSSRLLAHSDMLGSWTSAHAERWSFLPR